MSISNEFNYRVVVKYADNYQRYCRARLGVSVGTTKYDGEKLRAALHWADSRFRLVELRVSDTLQRYNMPGNPQDNFEKARLAGDAWLSRNADILSDYPFLIVYRWDDVRNDPNLPKHQQRVAALMQNPAFIQAFERDMEDFLKRRGGGDRDKCREFMTEELAVFDMLQEQRPAADIYPGTFLNCRKFMRDDFALTRIDFKRVPKPDGHNYI